ncbi:hypothetical protein ASD89_21545 [Caulobacter sp. Root656]|nr:hypothetical protein ASD89_21545 [Caulobacter sp. Root656]
MIDKRLFDAIGEANRASRMLDDLGGVNRATRQIEEATRAHRAFEALGGADYFTKQVALAQNADLIARRSGLIEDFERIEAARRAMQPALSVIDQLQGDKISVAAQAMALRLPDISLPDAAHFKRSKRAAGRQPHRRDVPPHDLGCPASGRAYQPTDRTSPALCREHIRLVQEPGTPYRPDRRRLGCA